tara:strand:+ start:225 stop:908 length:684 start_codon:yes stop_codon:yes gene_type:complete
VKIEEIVDKNIGKFEMVGEDAFITPFFNREYCNRLIDLFEDYGFKMDKTGNCDILMHKIKGGKEHCKSYLKLMKKYIEPKIVDVFLPVVKSTHADTGYRGLWSGYPVPFCKKWSADGGHTNLRMHNDNSLLTMVIFLADDYEGCETTFPRQNWDASYLKGKAGHMVVFPGGLTHPHYGQKLKSGTKYSLVGRSSILKPRNGEFDNIENLFSDSKWQVDDVNLFCDGV